MSYKYDVKKTEKGYSVFRERNRYDEYMTAVLNANIKAEAYRGNKLDRYKNGMSEPVQKQQEKFEEQQKTILPKLAADLKGSGYEGDEYEMVSTPFFQAADDFVPTMFKHVGGELFSNDLESAYEELGQRNVQRVVFGLNDAGKYEAKHYYRDEKDNLWKEGKIGTGGYSLVGKAYVADLSRFFILNKADMDLIRPLMDKLQYDGGFDNDHNKKLLANVDDKTRAVAEFYYQRIMPDEIRQHEKYSTMVHEMRHQTQSYMSILYDIQPDSRPMTIEQQYILNWEKERSATLAAALFSREVSFKKKNNKFLKKEFGSAKFWLEQDVIPVDDADRKIIEANDKDKTQHKAEVEKIKDKYLNKVIHDPLLFSKVVVSNWDRKENGMQNYAPGQFARNLDSDVKLKPHKYIGDNATAEQLADANAEFEKRRKSMYAFSVYDPKTGRHNMLQLSDAVPAGDLSLDIKFKDADKNDRSTLDEIQKPIREGKKFLDIASQHCDLKELGRLIAEINKKEWRLAAPENCLFENYCNNFYGVNIFNEKEVSTYELFDERTLSDEKKSYNKFLKDYFAMKGQKPNDPQAVRGFMVAMKLKNMGKTLKSVTEYTKTQNETDYFKRQESSLNKKDADYPQKRAELDAQYTEKGWVNVANDKKSLWYNPMQETEKQATDRLNEKPARSNIQKRQEDAKEMIASYRKKTSPQIQAVLAHALKNGFNKG